MAKMAFYAMPVHNIVYRFELKSFHLVHTRTEEMLGHW